MDKMLGIVRDLCRLLLTTDLSNPQVAHALNCHPHTALRYRARLEALGLDWSQVLGLDDVQLLAAINDGRAKARKTFFEPDWAHVDRELRRPGVTKALLYEEYRSVVPPEGTELMSAREYMRRFEAFQDTLDVTMRQQRKAGEAMFVDFSGKRPWIRDPDTGVRWQCEMFVAAVGASGKLYWEACPDQKLESWITANSNALAYFDGVPRFLVPDCLKSAVTVWGSPEGINKTYAELASHNGSTVMPTRPGKPRDKGLVENGVLQGQRWCLARLRNREFFSCEEYNAAAWELLEDFNNKPFKRRKDASRSSLFEELDRPELKPLPATPYEYAEWRSYTVPADYHVPCDGRYYSVPSTFKGKIVQVRASRATVRIFYANKEIAAHPRIRDGYQDSTVSAHRPLNHRQLDEEQVEYFRRWASAIGPNALSWSSITLR